MKKTILFVMFLLIVSGLTAQTYFTESFEGTWSGTLPAPAGWTQTHPTGTDTETWEKSVWSAGTWTPAGNGTKPGNAAAGTAVAHFNDFNSTTGNVFRLESGDINLASATNPRVTFCYFYNSGTAVLKVYASNNGGTSWTQIGTSIAATGANWSIFSNSLSGYNVANARIAFEVTSTYGSHDLWLDRIIVEETPSPVALTGTKTIKSSGGTWSNFTDAFWALNLDGVGAGGVTINVDAGLSLTEETPVLTATGTSGNAIIFQKSGAGANPVIKPTGGSGTDAGITIAGGDYITFDGIDINISTGSAVEYGYYIRNASATNGAQYNTIKNAKIILNRSNTSSRAIYQNVATTPTSATGANSYTTINNMTIENAYQGIYLTGNSTYPDLNLVISNCTIGASTPNDIGAGSSSLNAIRGTSQKDITISGNLVRNVTITGGANLYGIYLESIQGTTNKVFNNKLKDIKSTSTSTSSVIYGIRTDINSSQVCNVYNNVITGIEHGATSASSTQVIRAMAVGVSGTGTGNFYYNTVRIDEDAFPSSTCFYVNGGTVNMKNNLFANFSTAGATSKRYCIYRGSGTLTLVNYNNYYINTGGTGNNVGYYTSDQNTLALWQTASGKDANSKSVDPQFLAAGDYHALSATLMGAGVAITTPTDALTITTDIEGSTRAASPAIGAWEIVNCSTPLGGTAVATGATTFCGSGTPVITCSGYSVGIGTTYQWQYSTDNFVSDIQDFTGQTNPASLTSGTLSVTTYVRLKVTCSSTDAFSNVITITINPNPTVAINETGPFTMCQPATQALTCTTSASLPSYQWKYDDLNITGAVNSGYTADILGIHNYSVVATDGNTGCSSKSSAVLVTINPLPSAITISPSAPLVPVGNIQSLAAIGDTVVKITIISQNFNDATNNWTAANLSTGGTPANAAWTLRPDAYVYSSTTYHSNDNSQFYMTNSDAQGNGGTTSTQLTSPAFSLANMTTGKLKYYHYYNNNSSSYPAKVQISVNGGSSWTDLKTYTSDLGGAASFIADSADLTAYLGQSNVIIRFNYSDSWGYYWCVDNVTITGNQPQSVTWAPHIDLFSNSGATTPYAGEAKRTVYTKPDSTLTYTATATTAAGCTSEQTVLVTVCPAVPTGAAVSNVTATSFDYAWTSSQGKHLNAVKYIVQLADKGTFTDPLLASDTVTDPVVSKSYTGLTANTQYFVRVKASGDCESNWAPADTVVTCAGVPGTPVASVITDASFLAAWTAPAGGIGSALTYTLEVDDNIGFASPQTLSGLTDTSTTVTGLAGNTKIYFRVKAVGSCDGEWSAVDSAVTCPKIPVLLAPSGITAAAADINWSASVGGSAATINYTVEMSANRTFSSHVSGSPFTTTSLTHAFSGLTANTKYYYRVKAEGSCQVGFSTADSLVTCGGVPGTPGASAINSGGFTISWTAPGGGSASGITYTLEISTSSSFTSPISFTGLATTSKVVTGLNGNTLYYFRVKTVGNCDGDWSGNGTATTCPAVPGSPSATPASVTADISWSTSKGGEAVAVHYTIDVATSYSFLTGLLPSSPFTVNEPSITLNLASLTPNTVYYYKVKATGTGTCASSYSSTNNFTTCPGIPTGLTVSNLGATAFDLSWSAPAGGTASAVTYSIDLSMNPSFPGPQTQTFTQSGLTIHFNGLASDSNYYYRVKAVGSCSGAYASGTVKTLGCVEPVNLNAFATSGNSGYFAWSAPFPVPGEGYAWELLQGSTLIQSGTTEPETMNVSVSGLAVSTTYTVKVKSVCSSVQTSTWVTTTFTTTNCSVKTIPYADNFESYTPPNYGCLTVEDVNHDAVTWFVQTGVSTSGTKRMYVGRSNYVSMNDYFFTEGLSLTGGRSYAVKFMYRAATTSYFEKLEVKWGNGPMASMMNATPIFTNTFNSTTYTQGTGVFTAPADGVYWIGWHSFSDKQKSGIYVDDISVCLLPDVTDNIAGSNFICTPETGTVYSIDPLDAAASYIWTVPPGGVITNNTGTSITVDYPSGADSGYVTVKGVNSCGIGFPSTLAVAVNPELPVSVTIAASATTICENDTITFSIDEIQNEGPGPVYSWLVDDVEKGTSATFIYVPDTADRKVKLVVTSDAICAINNPDTSNVISITVIPQLVVGSISADATICEDHAPDMLLGVPPLTGHTPTYQWQESTDNVNFTDILGATNLNYQPEKLYDTTYYRQVQNASFTCGGPLLTNTVKVTVIPTVGTPTAITVAGGTVPSCQIVGNSTVTTFATTATNNTGFNWSLSDPLAGTIDNNGVMTWANGYADTVDIQVTANGCNGPSAMVTYPVIVIPTVGLPTAITVDAGTEPTCQIVASSPTTTYGTTATNNTGFNWSLSNPFAGTIDNNGLMTWTIGYFGPVDIRVSANGCNGPSDTVVRTVIMTPTVGTPTTITVAGGTEPTCQIANDITTTTYATTATDNTGFNWSVSNPAAGTIDNNGVMTWANGFSGTVTISVTANGCNGPSASVSRNVTLTSTVGTPTAITIFAGSDPTCQLTNGTTTTTYKTTATNNTGFNWSLSNPLAGSIGATSGIMTWANGFSGSVDIQVTANGCNGPSEQVVHTVNVTPTVGTPTAITPAPDTEPLCQLTNSTTVTPYSTTATNSTGFTWSVSNPAAGTINAAGEMTWNNGFNSTVEIRVRALGCNGPSAQVIRTVSVTPTIGTPVFALGGSSNRCQGVATITYSATSTNATGITYSLDDLSLAGGNTINPATGEVTYASTWSGTTEITAEATGCNGPKSSVHYVNITPVVGTPVPITIVSGTEPTCQLTNSSTVTAYTSSAANSTGLTWSLSSGMAGVIGASTGIMTWANGFSGTVDIRVVATGCNGQSPVTVRTVHVTPTVGNPTSITVAAGSEPPCQLKNATTTTTYATTASNSTGFIWTLSNSAAGTIDANGVMTWAEGFFGTVSIRVRAEGCNGPSAQIFRNVHIIENIPASVTIAADHNPSCVDQLVTYSATPVNGGSSPVYRWFLNDSEVIGETGPSYSFIAVNGDRVHCELTSSELCTIENPVLSAEDTLNVLPYLPVSVSIVASQNPLCANSFVTMTATPVNGGSNPMYQWYKNGVPFGADTNVFSFLPANNDVITCVLTSSELCTTGSPATSNPITITTFPALPVSISISASATTVCAGTEVTYNATAINPGDNPVYQWLVNGSNAGTNNPVFTFAPGNGNSISCLLTSSLTCVTGNPALSNSITTFVNPILPVTASIVASANPVCAGSSATFTATVTNPGLSPIYQWKKNNVPISGATTLTYNYVPANNDLITFTFTSSAVCPSANPVTSNTITMAVNPLVTPSVSITASSNPACAGSTVTFTPTPVNGGPSPTYEWRVNNIKVSTDPTYSYIPANGDRVVCRMTSNASCRTTSLVQSNLITMTMTPNVTVGVSIAASANGICEGTTVTYTATPANGGATPSYKWKVNSNDIAGATNSTFEYTPINNEVITCELTSSILCSTNNPATSAPIQAVVYQYLPVSVTIEADHESVCDGSPVNLVANPVNGGLEPTYVWKVNGNVQAEGSDPTFFFIPVDGDQVTCILTSSETQCVQGNPATSNTLTIGVNPILPVDLLIQPSANPVCEGTTVTFNTEALNAGTSPVYEWYLNSALIPGESGPAYSYAPQNFDRVTCVLTSSETCTSNNPAYTDTITMNVLPVETVSVSVTASSNPAAAGLPVTFTATGVNEGSLPVYQWYLNNAPAGTNSATFTIIPASADEIYCVLTSNAICQTGGPATSNTITMTVINVDDSVSVPSTIVHDGEEVCYNSAGTLYVGDPNTFVVEAGGIVTMTAGERILYKPGVTVQPGGNMHGYISADVCGYKSQTVVNTILSESKNPLVMESIDFRLYPNPTNSNFTLERKGGSDLTNVRIEIFNMQGKQVLESEMPTGAKHEFIFSEMPAGLYFVKLISGDHVETFKLVKNR